MSPDHIHLYGLVTFFGPKPDEFMAFRCAFISQTPVSHSFISFGSSSEDAEIGPESFGSLVFRSVGTVPDILGLAWPSFRPKSGSKSKIPGGILKSFRGPFSLADL